jgi:hypothetical protein
MKLITKELAEKLPKLYETEHVPPPEKVARVKLFHPISSWTWYVMEYDGQDTCFGLVAGLDVEFGYFSLQELSQVQVYGLPIERDLHFQPTQAQDLLVHNIQREAA